MNNHLFAVRIDHALVPELEENTKRTHAVLIIRRHPDIYLISL